MEICQSGTSDILTIDVFIHNIILFGSVENQLDLIKIHSVFDLKMPFINFWIDSLERNVKAINMGFSRMPFLDLSQYFVLRKSQDNILKFLEFLMEKNYVFNNEITQSIIKLLIATQCPLALTLTITLNEKIQSKDIAFINDAPNVSNSSPNLSSSAKKACQNKRIKITCFNEINIDEFVNTINNYHIYLYHEISPIVSPDWTSNGCAHDVALRTREESRATGVVPLVAEGRMHSPEFVPQGGASASRQPRCGTGERILDQGPLRSSADHKIHPSGDPVAIEQLCYLGVDVVGTHGSWEPKRLVAICHCDLVFRT